MNAISPGTIPHPEHYAQQWENAAEPEARSAKPGLGDKVDPEILRALAEQVPLQRLGTVDEIAGPISFLLSDYATYITGINLVVDGGWTIW